LTVTLRIMGGLGNQLYQYTAARYVQEMFSGNNISIDISGYKNYKVRKFELSNILNNSYVNTIEDHEIIHKIIKSIFHFYQKICKDLLLKHAGMCEIRLGKRGYICSGVEFHKPTKEYKHVNNLYLYGYFVSAEIAHMMKSCLINEITSPTNLSESYHHYRKIIDGRDCIGISIRCGTDYLTQGWPVCSKEYYISGIKKIKDKVSKDCLCLIFADDLDKVRKEEWFNSVEVMYVDNLSVVESFDLLRYCNHYVCSNSSFSWWGCFLSYCDNPIIYNPNVVWPIKFAKDNQKTFYAGMNILDYQSGEYITKIIN